MAVRFNGTATVTPSASSVGSSQITDGSIASADIADNAVTTAKIASQAVTLAKVDRTGADSGKVLTGNGTGSSPSWETPAASTPTTTRGDMIVRGASADVRLAIGPAGRALVSDGTDPAWTAITAAAIGAVPATRALAGLDLTADRTAAALQAALGITSGPELPATGLVMDFDASALSLGALASWASAVGSFVAAQATGSKQPVVTDHACGLHRAVVSDGTDDIMVIPHAAEMDTWTTLAVYAVFQAHGNASNAFTSAGTIVGRAHADSAGTAPYYRFGVRSDETTLQLLLGSGSVVSGGVSDSRRLSAGPHIAHACTGSAGSFTKIDGMYTGNAGTTSLSYPDARTWALFAGDYVTAQANHARIGLARLLVYANVTQTAATRRQVERYLAARYGVVGLGHTSYG